MENNEVLLTNELYKSIVEKIVGEMLELKKQQVLTLDHISIEKEVLKNFKKELIEIKKCIRSSRRNLREQTRALSKVNSDLTIRNSVLMKINNEFLLSEDRYINLQEFNFEEAPKKR